MFVTYAEMLKAAATRAEIDKVMRAVADDMSLDLGEYMVLTSIAHDRYQSL